VIYIAEREDRIIGFVAVAIEAQRKNDLLECVPSKAGRILELYVEERYRGQNIGKSILERAEEYLKQRKCDVLRIEVFEPNVKAHNFYQKQGYKDRIVDMIKKT
jgi:ribosomal protein S18 acetylase RimI-like enzyme